jgi:hypothetical protein
LAKDPVLTNVWHFYRGRGRRRRKRVTVVLMVSGTLLLIAAFFVLIAALISGKSTPNIGDDPMQVPTGS